MFDYAKTYSTKSFSYDANSKTFVTEASDLKGEAGSGCLFGRIYSDACDEGIFLRSHLTGHVAPFYVDREDTDKEGDLIAWSLKPVSEIVRLNPNLAGVRVTIFND